MSNDEIYESSLGFIAKQLDLHVKANEQANKKSKGKPSRNNNNNERKEETKSYKVLD